MPEKKQEKYIKKQKEKMLCERSVSLCVSVCVWWLLFPCQMRNERMNKHDAVMHKRGTETNGCLQQLNECYNRQSMLLYDTNTFMFIIYTYIDR